MFNVALKLRLVDLNYNFECDWLIELSDNNLASELVENRSFFKPINITLQKTVKINHVIIKGTIIGVAVKMDCLLFY